MKRQLVSSGSPYEPVVGFSWAVVTGFTANGSDGAKPAWPN